MSILSYSQYFEHVLRILSDGSVMTLKEISRAIADEDGLTAEELALCSPGGTPVFHGRVSWACTYLFHAGLVLKPANGRYAIAERGRQALESGRSVDLAYLSQFPEFREFVKRDYRNGVGEAESTESGPLTPLESIDRAAKSIYDNLEAELLNRIRSMPPDSFESLVVNLIRRMYGGDFEESSEVTGRTGDGGIDGIVRQDRLGFDTIYIQAKKWEGNVSRPEVQKFAGALQGRNATYGAFITSSGFTREAREFAEQASLTRRMVLVDGRDLVRYMFEYGVGVVERRTIVVKGVDEGYFDSLRRHLRDNTFR